MASRHRYNKKDPWGRSSDWIERPPPKRQVGSSNLPVPTIPRHSFYPTTGFICPLTVTPAILSPARDGGKTAGVYSAP